MDTVMILANNAVKEIIAFCKKKSRLVFNFVVLFIIRNGKNKLLFYKLISM